MSKEVDQISEVEQVCKDKKTGIHLQKKNIKFSGSFKHKVSFKKIWKEIHQITEVKSNSFLASLVNNI